MVLILLLLILVWSITFHPLEVQTEAVHCSSNQAPSLKPGQLIKVVSYNVQFMAGKNYVFFYDLPNNDGPDERPSPDDITKTIREVARIIRDEDPDVILLQEVDDGAKRTDYEDQLSRLLLYLPPEYCCYASAFYWKSKFVPHPCIMGSVGMKLTTISRYKIKAAVRYQLALIPGNPLIQQFNLKRSILETRFPVDGGQDLVVLNVHLEAFSKGTDVMQKQIAQIDSLLDKLTKAGTPWLAGGDYNLLPPGQYSLLQEKQRIYYKQETEIKKLYDKFQATPQLKDISGSDYQRWFTHFPNDPCVKAPNKTIDYIFFSDKTALNHSYVRQYDTLAVSDHLPVVAEFQLINR